MLRVRSVEPGDSQLLMEAAKADPYHSALGLTGNHWMQGDSLFYEDANGPVIALRTRNIVRVDIQFLTQDAKRNSQALHEGFWRYVEILKTRGITEIICNTNSPEVAQFLSNRPFRFRLVTPGTYSLYLG